MLKNHEYFMQEALKEALKAYEQDEIPVGAVVVKDKKIISKAHNIKEQTNNVANHAEIIALQKASQKLNTWKLDGCDLYVTLEPCLMCYGAIKQSRINTVFLALPGNENKDYSCRRYIEDDILVDSVFKEESHELIKNFFKEKR